METIYVYKSHAWYWFYLSDKKLTPEDLYCDHCDESDWLIGIYCDKKPLYKKLNELWKDGWTLLVIKNNSEISYKIIDKKYLDIPYAEICI